MDSNFHLNLSSTTLKESYTSGYHSYPIMLRKKCKIHPPPPTTLFLMLGWGVGLGGGGGNKLDLVRKI